MADDTYPWSGDFNDLSPEDQRTVAHLVVRGKAVDGTVDDLSARLKRTRCVALIRVKDGNRIVAAAAWKRPGTAYRQSKFKAANAPIAGFEAAPELGYIVRAADMQGRQLSGGLVDAIIRHIPSRPSPLPAATPSAIISSASDSSVSVAILPVTTACSRSGRSRPDRPCR